MQKRYHNAIGISENWRRQVVQCKRSAKLYSSPEKKYEMRRFKVFVISGNKRLLLPIKQTKDLPYEVKSSWKLPSGPVN